mmetsp:Transcript_28603/g.81792  ORF Transcript_28603/g.81792 Transcript_28603/m.81792 type:complete len:200 (+) Transcript_28603:796-1395(+)
MISGSAALRRAPLDHPRVEEDALVEPQPLRQHVRGAALLVDEGLAPLQLLQDLGRGAPRLQQLQELPAHGRVGAPLLEALPDHHPRAEACAVDQVRARTVLQQRLRYGKVHPRGGQVQRRGAAAVRDVGARAALQQLLHGVQVTLLHHVHQRRHALQAAVVRVCPVPPVELRADELARQKLLGALGREGAHDRRREGPE